MSESLPIAPEVALVEAKAEIAFLRNRVLILSQLLHQEKQRQEVKESGDE